MLPDVLKNQSPHNGSFGFGTGKRNSLFPKRSKMEVLLKNQRQPVCAQQAKERTDDLQSSCNPQFFVSSSEEAHRRRKVQYPISQSRYAYDNGGQAAVLPIQKIPAPAGSR